MSWEMEFTIRVSVDNDEQAERLSNAVYSGLAGELVRLGVLYGQLPMSGAVPTYSSQPATAGAIEDKKTEEQAVELKRVEDHVGKASANASKWTSSTVKRERTFGLAGRRRLGRA